MITETLRKYGAGEITAKEANKALSGTGISVDPLKGCVHGCWTKREMAEGFFDPAEFGFDPKTFGVLSHTPDMKRVPAFANLTVVQPVKSGSFEVTYDENGYAQKAVRV